MHQDALVLIDEFWKFCWVGNGNETSFAPTKHIAGAYTQLQRDASRKNKGLCDAITTLALVQNFMVSYHCYKNYLVLRLRPLRC